MWDIKSIMLFICSVLIIILISVKANATETGKSKAEWHALYVEAGCFNEGVNFVEREICKTKVFQKTNYNTTKEKLTGFFSKLNLD